MPIFDRDDDAEFMAREYARQRAERERVESQARQSTLSRHVPNGFYIDGAFLYQVDGGRVFSTINPRHPQAVDVAQEWTELWGSAANRFYDGIRAGVIAPNNLRTQRNRTIEPEPWDPHARAGGRFLVRSTVSHDCIFNAQKARMKLTTSRHSYGLLDLVVTTSRDTLSLPVASIGDVGGKLVLRRCEIATNARVTHGLSFVRRGPGNMVILERKYELDGTEQGNG